MDLEQYGGLEVTETDDSIEPGKYTMQYVDETQMQNDSGALASACGLTALKNTEELRGIKFNGMVKTNDKGYAELDSNFGKNFSKVEQATAKPEVKAEKPKAESTFTDDEIPF